jgi:hypothetical protein
MHSFAVSGKLSQVANDDEACSLPIEGGSDRFFGHYWLGFLF